MANLKETATWESGIYQIEENDPVHGGENGITNRPIKQLANRTKYLNDTKTPKTTTITAGNGLTGGGNLSAHRSLALGTPSTITATTTNSVSASNHSHAIDKASTTVAGIVQLNDTLTSTATNQALTANQGKILNDSKLNRNQLYDTGNNANVAIYNDVAQWSIRSDSSTGILAIQLPSALATMYSIEITGFNYRAGTSWTAHITGYQYTATSSPQHSVTINGKAIFNTVRLAHKDGRHYILLGDNSSTPWNHTAINIAKVMTSYNQNMLWQTGYSFELLKSVDEYNVVATPTIYGTPRALSSEKLVTARTINGVTFDGTQNITIADDTKTPKTTTITAGNGLTGGGDLSAHRSLALGTPSTITATTTNSVSASSHSHAIDKASTTVAGIVQLNNTLTSTATNQALTANQGKILFDALKQMGFDNLDKGLSSRSGIDLNTLTNAGATYVNYASVNKSNTTWWQSYNLPSAEITYAIVFTLKEGGNIIYQTLYSAGNGQVWFRYINVGSSTVLNNKGWTRLDGANWSDVRNKPSNIALLTDNIASATKLQTARTINGVAFDGTQNITIADDTKTPKTTTITAGNGLTGGGDLSAHRSLALGTPSTITATSANTVSASSHSHAIDKASTTVAGIVQLNDTLTSTATNQALTANQGKILNDSKLSKTENAVSATKLQTARQIALTGAVTGSVNFDGSSNVNITTTLKAITRTQKTGTLSVTHNSYKATTPTVNVTGSIEILPDGRIKQYFTITARVMFFYRYDMADFYKTTLGVSNFSANNSPFIELPLWTAMPNKIQEARIHLSSNIIITHCLKHSNGLMTGTPFLINTKTSKIKSILHLDV